MSSRHAVAASVVILVLGAVWYAAAPLLSLIALVLALLVFALWGMGELSRQRAMRRRNQRMLREGVGRLRDFRGSPDGYCDDVREVSA